MKTSLILPAYNEEKALPLTLDEYINFVDEIVVVNDGSKDNTHQIALQYSNKYNKIKYIQHEVNRGKPEALKTGVKNASGDIIIFTDADCTYPAKYIPEFLTKINKGADMVIGARIFNNNNIPFLNKVGNKIFSSLITYLTYTKIKDGQTGYRAMKRDIFQELDVEARSLEYETKMTIRAAKLGYNVQEISIEYRERVGKSKLNPFKDGFLMLKSIPTIIWEESTPLLKSVILVNLILFGIGMLFGFYSLYDKIVNITLTHDYYPLLAVVFILAAMQLMSFSLIMEFITNKLNKIDETIKTR